MELKVHPDVSVGGGGAELEFMPLALRKLRHSRTLSLTRQLSWTSSSSITSSTRSTSSSSQEFKWIRHAWILHFIVLLTVVYVGCRNNHDRKYILVKPVDAALLDCRKAFINVLATSSEDEGAVICLSGLSSRRERHDVQMPEYLPLARRLSRFPDAWLLPLFPFFIRGLVMLSQFVTRRQSLSDLQHEDYLTSLKRVGLYFFLMNVRMWVLYLLFNTFEEILASHASEETKETCWYHEWLQHDQPNCYGRRFDFSDHVVLYFSQILPIALIEVLHSFTIPFWYMSSSKSTSSSSSSPLSSLTVPAASTSQQEQLQQQQHKQEPQVYVPLALLLGLIYLYCITLIGAYKTASYFHTAGEVIVGILVSLIVQGPLCFLQCDTRWDLAREIFFGYPR